MFKSITIKNLRAITELHIENLGQFNLFVGQNNCGKTTILESLFFLIGATNPNLVVNVNTFRGLGAMSNELWPTYFHNMDFSVPIEIIGRIHDTLEEQKLLIRPIQKKVPSTKNEISDFVNLEIERGDSKPQIVPNGLELEYRSSENISEENISCIYLKEKNVEVEGLKVPPIRGIFISPLTVFDWKNRFGSVQRKKHLNEVIAFLKHLEPNIADLRLNEVGLLEADIGLPRLLPANLMGGGLVKFLSVALAFFDARNGFVLIDEIEDGLHHTAQQSIWKAMLSWAQDLNVQVFVTTHSWDTIGAFKDSLDTSLFQPHATLFRIERKDEYFRAVEYTRDNLAEALDSRWEVR